MFIPVSACFSTRVFYTYLLVCAGMIDIQDL